MTTILVSLLRDNDIVESHVFVGEDPELVGDAAKQQYIKIGRKHRIAPTFSDLCDEDVFMDEAIPSSGVRYRQSPDEGPFTLLLTFPQAHAPVAP